MCSLCPRATRLRKIQRYFSSAQLALVPLVSSPGPPPCAPCVALHPALLISDIVAREDALLPITAHARPPIIRARGPLRDLDALPSSEAEVPIGLGCIVVQGYHIVTRRQGSWLGLRRRRRRGSLPCRRGRGARV